MSATKERCGCYCTGAGGLCGRAPIAGDKSPVQYQCTSTFGNDANNCGACGRTCSENASCRSGCCLCPKDQCGERCLGLLTHPNHCGRCSNKCASEYCFQGQCYDPPKDKCAPVQGVQSGDFTQGGQGWQLNDRYAQEGSQVTMDGGRQLRVWVEDTQ